ncbi:rho GTPase-activating protein 31 [Pelobates fuscus]|uniref:rho GTPase-activating protein 31 n=1 Tax=Pelobates fuscus TaxID=191477 RepID=UPI002FE43AF7
MKNKGAKTKFKRKGSSGAFGCDLTEYLETSGQNVPLVLKSCAEFIETHGVVDGIYRLSGVTSNIQKLRQEFGSDQCPDLTKEVYLQDIHCVGSLCKLYFRELPNPLLTYQLYKKFTDAVSCTVEGEQLSQIQNVIQELPPSHYRTLEYLSKHLTNIASHSAMTNMHIRNLALVWAPNLLRSKEIEDAGCNGDAAFLEVRVQQVVIEFILNNVDQIFNKNPPSSPKPFPRDECRVIVKSMTLPSGSSPMKLVSLQEAQAMSLSATHPARKERRENSLPEIVPPLFHTVIDLPENKRKLSTKSKKWKSIFNLGRSGAESKSKLSRNGSVFVRGQKEMNEKTTIRPAKSMDSLCSLPAEGEEEKVSRFKRSVGSGGFFIPMPKSRATGSGSSIDVSKPESEFDSENVIGATGDSRTGSDRTNPKISQFKPPPEQMKVFRVGEDLENEQTSPKIRKMFYSSSDGPAKSSFPASLFPLEASPRHQRKAINISEPFAVSVPLRVSAVISSNSTPCRGSTKERHFLSSLEELPSLEPDSVAKLTVLEMSFNSGLKDQTYTPNPNVKATPEEGKQSSPKCADDQNPPGTVADDKSKDIKEGVLERTQLQDTSSNPKADDKPSSEHGPVSITSLEKAMGLESVVSDQVEAVRNDVEDLFDNDQEDDASINLLDPLWSDIQQELKIIESEEELPAEINQTLLPCDQETSLQLNKPSDGFICILVSPKLNEGYSENSFVLDNMSVKDENRTPDSDPSIQTKLEKNIITASSSGILQNDGTDLPLPQEQQQNTDKEQTFITMREMWPNHDLSKDESNMSFVSIKGHNPCVTQVESQTESDCKLEVVSDIVSLPREDDQELKRIERKSNGSLENDEDTVADSIHTFELDEFWEDHQWVTSPLHSPKLKNIPEKEVQVMQRRGTGELYKRPEFTRSLSLDSKDSRTSQWTRRHTGMLKAEGVISAKMEINNILKPFSKNNLEHRQFDQNPLDLPELLVHNESFAGQQIDRRQKNQPVVDVLSMNDKGPLHSNLLLSTVPLNSKPMLPAVPLNSIDCPHELQSRNSSSMVCNPEPAVNNFSSNTEDPNDRPKTRPSSLTLDSSVTSTYFTFESAPHHNSNNLQRQQIETISSASKMSSSDRSIHTTQWQDEAWMLQPRLQTQVAELDSVPITHAPSGRRNSAPVSVSAIRASFMIKLCQAKAVPVIPPKIQYTQIPQPLQTVNADSEVSLLEKKHGPSECNFIPQQTDTTYTGQTNIPKSPKPEEKSVEEKENNDPISLESSQHSSLNCSTDTNHNGAQEGPVLRRKRTSDGEATGDTPLSSKIERPSLVSKHSFRSRPGRPQSLILFSPPFPIMDHPSPGDSRILLTPIKCPSQTSSQESTNEAQRTPDGVLLRNKLTIPKNGQRLETSTSCFYQPQRRSVILDSRSGRQIE